VGGETMKNPRLKGSGMEKKRRGDNEKKDPAREIA
jgi:hypothetical protein